MWVAWAQDQRSGFRYIRPGLGQIPRQQAMERRQARRLDRLLALSPLRRMSVCLPTVCSPENLHLESPMSDFARMCLCLCRCRCLCLCLCLCLSLARRMGFELRRSRLFVWTARDTFPSVLRVRGVLPPPRVRYE